MLIVIPNGPSGDYEIMRQTAIFQVFNFASLAKKAFRRSIGVRIREEAEIIEGEAFFCGYLRVHLLKGPGLQEFGRFLTPTRFKIQDSANRDWKMSYLADHRVIDAIPTILSAPRWKQFKTMQNNLSF